MDTADSIKYQWCSSGDDVSDNVLFQTCFLLDICGGYPSIDFVRCDGGRFCGATMTSYGKCSVTPGDKDKATAAMIANVVSPLIDELLPVNEYHNGQVISEPGQYFVELKFALCIQIYSVRVDADRF